MFKVSYTPSLKNRPQIFKIENTRALLPIQQGVCFNIKYSCIFLNDNKIDLLSLSLSLSLWMIFGIEVSFYDYVDFASLALLVGLPLSDCRCSGSLSHITYDFWGNRELCNIPFMMILFPFIDDMIIYGLYCSNQFPSMFIQPCLQRLDLNNNWVLGGVFYLFFVFLYLPLCLF